MENGINSSTKMNKKTIIMIVVALVILIAVAILAFGAGQKKATDTGTLTSQTPPSTITIREDGTKTEKVAPEVVNNASVQVAGADLVTKDNKVVTAAGVVTVNNAAPMSPEAPKQTQPIAKEQLSAAVIKLDVSEQGFVPTSFTVKAGAPVSVAISATGEWSHVFFFDDASLSAVAVGVSPHETRAITFNAPVKAGTYTFRCDVPGHKQRGEVGSMIVK